MTISTQTIMLLKKTQNTMSVSAFLSFTLAIILLSTLSTPISSATVSTRSPALAVAERFKKKNCGCFCFKGGRRARLKAEAQCAKRILTPKGGDCRVLGCLGGQGYRCCLPKATNRAKEAVDAIEAGIRPTPAR